MIGKNKKVDGIMARRMAMENWSGQMANLMLDNFTMELSMAEVKWIHPDSILMMGCGKMGCEMVAG